ncbi:MAG TPA: sensor histidine kinase, partial [Actinomycetota bacterium]|nr:sensor histidine kinase [Actinomycetota bacterium]
TVHIDDDANGVEPPSAAATPLRPGRGLVGMRERVTALGGELTTGPRPGGGFRVLARLPLQDAEGGQA